MSAWYVDCPRCGGTGIRVLRAHKTPDGGEIRSAEIICITCIVTGLVTGQASLLDKMHADVVKEVTEPVERWQEVRHSVHAEDVTEAGDALAAALEAERARADEAVRQKTAMGAAHVLQGERFEALERYRAERDRAHATLREIVGWCVDTGHPAGRLARERLENP